MTPQEIFDIALNTIRYQGGPSVSPAGVCQYKSPNGRMCAAAPFIKEYDVDLEMRTFQKIPSSRTIISALQVDLVTDLQSIHDVSTGEARLAAASGTYDTPEERSRVVDEVFMPIYEDRMERFAKLHGLEYTP